MKEANRYSILGIILALLTLGVFSSDNFLSRAIAGLNLAGLPRELRLGIDAGFIKATDCNSRYLNRRCSKGNFAQKVSLLLEHVGAMEDTSLKSLAQNGIFNAHHGYGSLRRKDALEALARLCTFLSSKNLIDLPNEAPVNYSDYKIAEKYAKEFNFMQKRFVVRGYPNGSVGANKRLSNREAVYFVYRLYEAVATEMMANNKQNGLRFVDISLSHPVMQSIKTLTNSGAFDKVMLRPAFDGDSNISQTELSQMLGGIFARAGIKVDEIRVHTIFAGAPDSKQANRRQLAMILEYILASGNSKAQAKNIAEKYSDVSKDSIEYEALARLAAEDIFLGYPDGRFNAGESVTWFETVYAMAKVLANWSNGQQEKPYIEPDRLAQKSDIDSFIALIKAKRAKVRKILEQRPYRR
ncbi:MAG: hypothetical protein PWR01_2493 [Clostridiales bacterium]|nr:hypothetical protein [Clostridiales bacterium]MDN5281420.1 hypothetical protein [Candidatus Ozemobacter sp.]